ncbi:hypothetical protein ABZ707_33255 [Streptomyces sp. NPDC006923]
MANNADVTHSLLCEGASAILVGVGRTVRDAVREVADLLTSMT